LYRTAEIIWALSSVDREHHQSQLELDSVHHGMARVTSRGVARNLIWVGVNVN